MNGHIYVAGGQDGIDSYLSAVECYDPLKDGWTQIPSMIHPRANFALAESNGKLYAIGHHKAVEQYDPDKKEWTVVCTQSKSRNCFSNVSRNDDAPLPLYLNRLGFLITATKLYALLRCAMKFSY